MRQGKQNASQATKILNGYKGSDASDKPVKIFHRAFFHNKIMFGIERRKEMKLFGKKFALVLALVAVLAMAGSALAADIYVSATGNDSAGDGTAENPYATVAKAVEVANGNGEQDMIHVGEGEFTVKNVAITTPIKLIGTGADKTTFTAELTSQYTDYMLCLGNAGSYGADISGSEVSGISFECTTTVAQTPMIYLTGKGSEGNNIVIKDCSFVGKPDGTATTAIAISTPYSNDIQYVTVSGNKIQNAAYGMYFNSIQNAEITGNEISDTKYNAINIANDNASYAPSNITIADNTMTNISTEENYNEPLYASGINVGGHPDEFNVTNNTINMATGKQSLALNGDSINKGAQVTTPDGDNVYFSTLTEAVQSDKSANSTITLLSEPTKEEKNLEIGNGIKIANADKYNYEPNYVENAPAAPAHSGGGSGGCSAGFGALALLAAVPLLFRKKK